MLATRRPGPGRPACGYTPGFLPGPDRPVRHCDRGADDRLDCSAGARPAPAGPPCAPTGTCPPPPGCTPPCGGGARRSRGSRPTLPQSGRVLEIGCGHGLFSTYAALAGYRTASVVGVDIDADKIALARRVAAGLPGADLRSEVAESGAVAGGTVGRDRRRRHAVPAAGGRPARPCWRRRPPSSAPGGLLLVKEMSPTPRWKATLEPVAGDPGGVGAGHHRSGTARVHPISTSSTRTRWRPGCATTACGPLSSGWTGTGCTRTTWSSVGSARIRRHDQDRHDQDRHDQDQS